VALSGLVAVIAGCSTTLSYYSQLLKGQWQLMASRRPISEVIADPGTPMPLRSTLERVEAARSWASRSLDLPDNGSYTQYADLGRDAVLWNVFATPEFSLTPQQWCYPLVGCLAYRGYYTRAAADAEASRLAEQGLDVYVGAVPAYSTLGWFDDPVINTMLPGGDAQLIGTIFHELAHQRLFLRGDTAFNESYASFVEDEGLAEYRAAGHLADVPLRPKLAAYRHRFTERVLAAREALEALYRQPFNATEMRRRKSETFDALKSDYARIRDDEWDGFRGYDRWFDRPLNNAMLLPVGLYDGYKAGFEGLFVEQGCRWPQFHDAARALSKLPQSDRERRLDALAAQSPGDGMRVAASATCRASSSGSGAP